MRECTCCSGVRKPTIRLRREHSAKWEGETVVGSSSTWEAGKDKRIVEMVQHRCVCYIGGHVLTSCAIRLVWAYATSLVPHLVSTHCTLVISDAAVHKASLPPLPRHKGPGVPPALTSP